MKVDVGGPRARERRGAGARRSSAKRCSSSMDGQQEEPQGQAFEEPLDNTLTDSLKSFAGEQPMLTALLALGVIWFIATQLKSSAGGVTVGGDGSKAQDAMRAARERQQAQLAAAAEHRMQMMAPAAVSFPPVASTPPDGRCSPNQEMPSRMKKAMERQDAADAAARRADAGAAAPPPAPATTNTTGNKKSMAERLARIEGTAPSAAAANNNSSTSDGKKPKESMTERLARIERGKGPSDHNPLHGHSSGSSAGGVINRKKGGG